MLSGIVNLDKPAGLTSQEAVSRVKRILRSSKAGHCGTLDPSATGVLLVCVGPATRFADYLQARPKTYEAILKLGESTDTQDAEGRVLSRNDISGVTESDVSAVVRKFTGRILQTPPMYSALKLGGTPLHKLARRGVTVDREPRNVEIYAIEIRWLSPPLVALSVTCAKGVYIRTLCHDIGERLGVGGHMQSLRRTAVGEFTVDTAISLESLEPSDVVAPADALSFLGAVQLDPESLQRLQHGQHILFPENDVIQGCENLSASEPIPIIRLMNGDNVFAGLGRIKDGLVQPERLLPTELSQTGPSR